MYRFGGATRCFSNSVFPADPFIKDDSKDWWSSENLWPPLIFLTVLYLLVAPDNKAAQDQSS